MSVVYRLDNQYMCGAQVNLYIDDVVVDEIQMLAYELNIQQRPIYSYADRIMRGVSTGRQLVRGNLAITFRYPGYLWAYIKKFQEKKSNDPNFVDGTIKTRSDMFSASTTTTNKGEQLSSVMLPISVITGTSDISSVAEDYVQSMKESYWGDKSSQGTSMVSPEFTNDFNIIIYYGDPNDPETQYEKIANVMLSGKTKTLQNNADTLLEVYPFIASTVI